MELIFVFSGFIIVAIAVLLYLNLLEKMNLVDESIDKKTKFVLRVYLVLMFFLLTCHSFIGTSILLGINFNSIRFIGVLLFFGSIIVNIGIITQDRLVNCIHTVDMQVLRSLISMIEAKDVNLKGHSLHVRYIGLLIFDNLPKSILKNVSRLKFEIASLIHDVGKLGIPEGILNKPSHLTDEEWSIMKKHPKIGIQIIENVKGFDTISEWILYHHERIDGKGYYGLVGNEIPLASKIMCIADAYSAIVMDRLYRKAKEHEEAIRIMNENSGTQFDPEILEVFVNIDNIKTKVNIDSVSQIE
jgi:HD-GYP domain-containing protein (c-di-GMP phosphodiesterase class II)